MVEWKKGEYQFTPAMQGNVPQRTQTLAPRDMEIIELLREILAELRAIREQAR